MLTRLFPFLDSSHVTLDRGRRLRALADDCDRLERGRSVSPALLRKVPLLEDSVPAITPQDVQLIGHVTGPPLLGDCPAAATPLWFADPNGTWVRSLSRFYRLGPPHYREDLHRALKRMATSSASGGNGSEDEA